MNISGVEIGADSPCRVVAEISNNHNGSIDTAFRLIDAVQEAGADLVKFQAYTPDELVQLRGNGSAPDPWGAEGWTMRDLYEKAQTPLRWFGDLSKHCESIGLPWFASVFGVGSLAVLEAFGCPAYKLASLDFSRRKLLGAVKGTSKPVVRSVPTANAAVSDVTLWCPPGYPQTVSRMAEGLRRHDGFSYHGTDPLVPALAAAFGAKVLEVHVQLDDEPSELEAGVSLTVSQLAQLVGLAKVAEAVA